MQNITDTQKLHDALEQAASAYTPETELADNELETVAGGTGGEDISSGDICKVLENLRNIRI